MWHGVTDNLTAPELATRMSHEPLHCPDVLMWPERGLSSWFPSVTQSQFGMSVAVLSPVIKGMTYSLQLTGWMSLLQVKDSIAFFLVEDNIAFSPFTFHKRTAFAWVAPVREKMSNLGFSLKKTIPDGSSPGNRARGDLMGKEYWLCKYRCDCSILALFFSQEEGRIEMNVVSTYMQSQKTGIRVVVWSDIFYKGQQFLGYFFISPKLFSIFWFIEMTWNGSCLKFWSQT